MLWHFPLPTRVDCLLQTKDGYGVTLSLPAVLAPLLTPPTWSTTHYHRATLEMAYYHLPANYALSEESDLPTRTSAADDDSSDNASSMEEIIVNVGGCPVHFTVPKNRNVSLPAPEDDAVLEAQGRAFMAELEEVESFLTPEIWAQYRAAMNARDRQHADDLALLAELEAVEGAMTRDVWDRIWAGKTKAQLDRVLALKRQQVDAQQREYRDEIMDPEGTVEGMIEATKVLAVARRKHLREVQAKLEQNETTPRSARKWPHDENVREILKGYDHLKESLQREGGSPCNAEETRLVLKKLASVEAQRMFLEFGDHGPGTQVGVSAS
ncbi:hypothetical protein B0A48_10243 [Cryoendolithus antarcticus]|uniref:Uncharacterized protein n=1 Tax=Cryoendolithus antarcticus TaxID=1507870 RepID=A0A1V8SX77_9PEZI|nr:hypothetical protein B0A48_10243 [Cryoendolithus antarcticus]